MQRVRSRAAELCRREKPCVRDAQWYSDAYVHVCCMVEMCVPVPAFLPHVHCECENLHRAYCVYTTRVHTMCRHTQRTLHEAHTDAVTLTHSLCPVGVPAPQASSCRGTLQLRRAIVRNLPMATEQGLAIIIQTHTRTHAHTHTHTHTHTHHTHAHVCMYVCMYVCIYVQGQSGT